VQLPKQMLKVIPKEYFDGNRGTLKLLWEEEWRALGITQSLGWEHYEVHEPEPHILLFKYVSELAPHTKALANEHSQAPDQLSTSQPLNSSFGHKSYHCIRHIQRRHL
jgi:hypothetical protein